MGRRFSVVSGIFVIVVCVFFSSSSSISNVRGFRRGSGMAGRGFGFRYLGFVGTCITGLGVVVLRGERIDRAYKYEYSIYS